MVVCMPLMLKVRVVMAGWEYGSGCGVRLGDRGVMGVVGVGGWDVGSERSVCLGVGCG